MTFNDIGALRRADEGLNHQIADTFATVAESDHAWTEKIWASLARTDGSLQIDFGLGKYQNRGIIDGFGGISRGREQWTVRASRELHTAPEDASIGPVHYEIVQPLERVRFVLEPNDVLPISFDVVLAGVTPPFFEERNLIRNQKTGRVDIDVIRYHQGGHVMGAVTVDGDTHDVGPDDWFGFRDHSWGVRQNVGAPLTDVIPAVPASADRTRRSIMKWTPSFFRRPDGTYYETSIFVSQGWGNYVSAYVNDTDGRQQRARSVHPRMTYDPVTRFIHPGELVLGMDSGEERRIEVEPLGESGFFLRTAGYGRWGDALHGVWRGPLAVDGEYIADCWDDDHRRRLGQFRDRPVRVREGDAVGYGIMESIVAGDWPEFGLTAQSDHRVSYR
jgi:hypothetical protein